VVGEYGLVVKRYMPVLIGGDIALFKRIQLRFSSVTFGHRMLLCFISLSIMSRKWHRGRDNSYVYYHLERFGVEQ
jgi:hypothetical protein